MITLCILCVEYYALLCYTLQFDTTNRAESHYIECECSRAVMRWAAAHHHYSTLHKCCCCCCCTPTRELHTGKRVAYQCTEHAIILSIRTGDERYCNACCVSASLGPREELPTTAIFSQFIRTLIGVCVCEWQWGNVQKRLGSDQRACSLL